MTVRIVPAFCEAASTAMRIASRISARQGGATSELAEDLPDFRAVMMGSASDHFFLNLLSVDK